MQSLRNCHTRPDKKTEEKTDAIYILKKKKALHLRYDYLMAEPYLTAETKQLPFFIVTRYNKFIDVMICTLYYA